MTEFWPFCQLSWPQCPLQARFPLSFSERGNEADNKKESVRYFQLYELWDKNITSKRQIFSQEPKEPKWVSPPGKIWTLQGIREYWLRDDCLSQLKYNIIQVNYLKGTMRLSHPSFPSLVELYLFLFLLTIFNHKI